MLRNRTQLDNRYYITSEAKQWLDKEPIFCSVIHSVFTDDPVGQKRPIERWIQHECKRSGLTTCLVKDMTGHFERTTVVGKSLVDSDSTAQPIVLETKSPTLAPTTAAPTLASQCSQRTKHEECLLDGKCDWFGALTGCQSVDYCGFKTSTACQTRWNYCEWRGRKCVHKP